MKPLKILALSGSLRKASYNTAALAALKILAPGHIEIVIGEIATLPLFNPDRENDKIPQLEKLKSLLIESEGLIIASPEYAHGISGPMKNALDWLVSGIEFPHKPIMLINTSPRASIALTALKEVLMTMSGNIVESASVTIPLLSSELNSTDIVQNQKMANLLMTGLDRFYDEIARKQI